MQCRLHAAIQKRRGDDGFHGICQNGLPGPAAALLLAVAQEQVFTQMDLLGNAGQRGLADHIRPHSGQFPFGAVREIPVKVIRYQHSQNAVSQEFQPLIAEQAVVPTLVGIGGMGQGILQKGDIMKMIADLRFQIFNHWFAPSIVPAGPMPAPDPA